MPDNGKLNKVLIELYVTHDVQNSPYPPHFAKWGTGLKFFFNSTLDHPELMRHTQPVREPRKIPIVLSPEEVARLIGCAGNLKNQTALSIAYGAGLRASEVVALKVSDIDNQRVTLRIEQGKVSR
jgi:integrase